VEIPFRSGTIDGGRSQRLCLARGLAVEPEVILGDEPTSALDPLSAERIEQRLLELKNKYTIVLVTHIFRQANGLLIILSFCIWAILLNTALQNRF
jgi:phosphate transport system ATP-binding protein